jgi:hypothetical protein
MSEPVVTTAPAAVPAKPVDPMVAVLEKARAAAEAATPKDQAAPSAQATAATKDPTSAASSDDDLGKFAKLHRQKLELEAKLKEAEGSREQVKTLMDAKALVDQGKKLEAFALLTGKDSTEELTSLLESYIGETPADDKDKLAKEVADIKAKLDAEAKEKTKAGETQAKQAAEQFVGTFLDKHTDKFEVAARTENRQESIEAAIDGALYLAKKRGLDLTKVDQEGLDQLMLESMEGVEKTYEARAKRYSKQAQARAGSAEATGKAPAIASTRSDGRPPSEAELLEKYRSMAQYQ